MTLTDYEFGFPITLHKVESATVNGEVVFNIDYLALHNDVLRGLIHRKHRLTGNEVRFVRLALGLNLTEFGKLFDVTHAAVISWERSGDSSTSMSEATEILMRLRALQHLECDDVEEIMSVMNIRPVDVLEISYEPMEFIAPTKGEPWVKFQPELLIFGPRPQVPETRCDALAVAA